jgi:citrate lyase subunit beta/citryl-CoA lyase
MSFVMGPALLFCPADRPERFQKAAERSDAVILDLEDAVAPADKKDHHPDQPRRH